MSTEPIDLTQEIANMLDALEAQRQIYVSAFEERDRAELEALQQELLILQKNLGADHPYVVTLTQLIQEAQQTLPILDDMVRRTTSAPAINSGDWRLVARVRSADGQLQAGLTVRLIVANAAALVVLLEAVTDANGEVFGVVPFASITASLFVSLLVLDASKQTTLYTYPNTLWVQNNGVQSLELTLPAVNPATPGVKAPATPGVKAPTSPVRAPRKARASRRPATG